MDPPQSGGSVYWTEKNATVCLESRLYGLSIQIATLVGAPRFEPTTFSSTPILEGSSDDRPLTAEPVVVGAVFPGG